MSNVDPTAYVPAQLRRRRRASHRLPVLDCSRRDPLDLERGEDLTPAALAAWGMAIDHLLLAGLTPIVPAAVRRARRG